MQVQADLLRRVPLIGPPTMIVALGVGQEISTAELNNMASWPYSRNAIVVRSFDDLAAADARLTSVICGGECHRNICQWVSAGASTTIQNYAQSV